MAILHLILSREFPSKVIEQLAKPGSPASFDAGVDPIGLPGLGLRQMVCRKPGPYDACWTRLHRKVPSRRRPMLQMRALQDHLDRVTLR